MWLAERIPAFRCFSEALKQSQQLQEAEMNFESSKEAWQAVVDAAESKAEAQRHDLRGSHDFGAMRMGSKSCRAGERQRQSLRAAQASRQGRHGPTWA